MNKCKHIEGPPGYIDRFAWAMEQIEKGRKQIFCQHCDTFYFIDSKPKRKRKPQAGK